MPPRRKHRFKRRLRHKRRNYYKRKKYSKWGAKKYNIHKYRRMGRTSTIQLTANASGEMPVAFNFNLQDMVNSSELTTLYDQYRIDFVTVQITWSPKNVNQTNFNVGPNLMSCPVVYYSKDYDDNTFPTTLTAFKERGNIRSLRISPLRKYKISLKPAVQNAVIRDATVVPPLLSTNPVWNKKLDCAAANIPHLGLKLLFDYAAGTNMASVDIQTIYHVTMFGTR